MMLESVTLGVLAILVGWVIGGLVNWAADVLPGVQPGARPDFSALWRDRAHYWVSSWSGHRHDAGVHREQKAARRYLVINLCAIGLAFLMMMRWGLALETAIGWLYLFFFLAVTVIDLEHHRVLNVMLAPAAVVVALISLLPIAPDLWSMVVGGMVGFGLFLLLAIIGRGALGMGDVKLAGVIGMMLGFPNVLTALTVGAILGGVGAAVMLILRKATRKSAIAYAPYLAFGALLTIWFQLNIFR